MVQHVTVIFVVVLIGYGFLSRSNVYRHRLLTDSNYAVLYESAIAGGLFFVVVWITLNAFKSQFFDCTSLTIIEDRVCWFEARYPLPQLDVIFLASVLATLLVLVSNLIYTREKVGEKIARESGLIGKIVLEALDGDHLLQVTTVRNKVYVGWILTGPGMSKQGKVEDVAIVPLYGGFRDPSSHRVLINVNYASDVSFSVNMEKEDDLNSDVDELKRPELNVVIPMGEIALIRRTPENLVEALNFIDDDIDFLPADDLEGDVQRF